MKGWALLPAGSRSRGLLGLRCLDRTYADLRERGCGGGTSPSVAKESTSVSLMPQLFGQAPEE
jgi:hypothetical protein